MTPAESTVRDNSAGLAEKSHPSESATPENYNCSYRQVEAIMPAVSIGKSESRHSHSVADEPGSSPEHVR